MHYKTIGIILFIISLIMIIGMSIWLGFPSPIFNQQAITITAYFLGTFLFILGFTLYLIGGN